MEEILNFISNNGFAIVMCLLLFLKMLPKLDKLTNLITNDLFHIIEKDAENTEKVEKAVDRLDKTIGRFIDKI
ncbi:unnamed protein product [marine sediment metagenome]|uniref:YvrJ family protein n=1 Tax=marine sediment metagenome TaxID=412755 RepID=X1KSV1_9ZZZZ